jgi:EMC6
MRVTERADTCCLLPDPALPQRAKRQPTFLSRFYVWRWTAATRCLRYHTDESRLIHPTMALLSHDEDSLATAVAAASGAVAGVLRLRGVSGLLFYVSVVWCRVLLARGRRKSRSGRDYPGADVGGSGDARVSSFDKALVSTYLMMWILVYGAFND